MQLPLLSPVHAARWCDEKAGNDEEHVPTPDISSAYRGRPVKMEKNDRGHADRRQNLVFPVATNGDARGRSSVPPDSQALSQVVPSKGLPHR